MEEQDDKLIERFYLNDLSEAELAAFHRRMAEDEAFWEAVQLHVDAMEAIRLEGIAMLRKRLTDKGRELDADKHLPANRWLWWMLGLAAIVIGTWAVWNWMRPETLSPPLPMIENGDFAPSLGPDTLPAQTPLIKQTEPIKKTPNHQQVFAAWFKPYKDPSLEPSRRGGAAQSPSERFQQLYWDGEYRAALAAFDSLGVSVKNNDNLMFLKANCLLTIGNANAAEALLNNLRDNNRSRFGNQVDWYLALSHLQASHVKEAEALLLRIAADKGSVRRSDAARLLRELN